MFDNGIAYAVVFSTLITFALVANYMPLWVAVAAAALVFWLVVRGYEEDDVSL